LKARFKTMSHIQEAQGCKLPLKLRDLLKQLNDNPKDVDLYHWDYDEESATMVDLSLKDFTEDGLMEFKVALDMEVVQIKDESDSWISVWVKGTHKSHVETLSLSHAGYCSADDYDKWFTINNE